jgi:hypothetical protein
MAISRWPGRGVAEARNGNPFNAATIIWVIVAGALAFAGFLFLLAYAPDMRKGDGGANAVSKSAIGYSGLHAIERDLHGKAVTLAKTQDDWMSDGLLIVTLGPQADPKALEKLLKRRIGSDDELMTTLIVLPKWNVAPDLKHRGWVRKAGALAPFELQPLLKVLGKVEVGSGDLPKGTRLVRDDDSRSLPVPDAPRWMTRGVFPVISAGSGRIILGRLDGRDGAEVFVLADPDLLANHGLKTAAGADAAVQMIENIRPYDADAIVFDDLTQTAGTNRNLLQLMFEPPFLAFTIALLIAAILTGLHAIARFGPPRIEGRAIPFGKRALADNAALLVSRAGREARLGDRYVAVVRDAVGNALGAQGLSADDLERWLGRLPGGFNDLAVAARNAPDAASMRTAAAALYAWKKDVTRDHR